MSGWNYFNYFTEIEEYFWKKRGANLLVSPLDWAIMEAWQQAGVPLEAALKGIDRAFESHARSRRGGRPMKSLAYCTDAVLEAAEEAQEAIRRRRIRKHQSHFRAKCCEHILRKISGSSSKRLQMSANFNRRLHHESRNQRNRSRSVLRYWILLRRSIWRIWNVASPYWTIRF